MWTSERNRHLPVRESGAELGVVTLGGDPAGVNLGGERRWLPVCCPGGYFWRPNVGDEVLVLKAGAEQESPCILGMTPGETDLKPGEVRVSSGGSAVSLLNGRLELNGRLFVNGVDLEAYVRAIVADMLSNVEG